jgi:nicotinate dehydrogenase subunit B
MNSPAGSLPHFIVENPRLLDWFAFALPRKLTLKTGKVEIGQDILTALRQIAAEELELPLSLIEVLSGDTGASPNEGPTVASLSIMMSGPAVRVAATEMRGRLFQAAAVRLAVPVSQLSAIEGVFHVAGTATEENYWTVVGDVDLEEPINGAFPSRDQGLTALSVQALFLPTSSRNYPGRHSSMISRRPECFMDERCGSRTSKRNSSDSTETG